MNCTPFVRQYGILKTNGVFYCAKREAKQEIYTEFKKMVIETMLEEKLGYRETARRFQVCNHYRIQQWEQIYLTEGPEGFEVERRGRGTKDVLGSYRKR